jgi:bifunctional UDP-N-acetylglucosamine pyrophosphorylase/glucosamine-1-phosphate N-acetyltransferase
MRDRDITSVILAAGQGKRMKSSLPKVLHPVAGVPMISYSLALTKALGIKKRMVVLGHRAAEVKEIIKSIDKEVIHVYQNKQLGTAQALEEVKPYLTDFSGIILVLSADVPLLQQSTIQKIVNYHLNHSVVATLLIAKLENPAGYGRIIRNQAGEIMEIAEQSDLKKGQEEIKEINAGIYCFNSKELFNTLPLVNKNNYKKEYYLTDIIKILKEQGYLVGSISVTDYQEITGINTQSDLSQVSQIVYYRNALEHMSGGVTIIAPANTFIEKEVQIGEDTVVYPFTIITSGSKIGSNCYIGPYSHIVHSLIGNQTKIISSMVEQSQIGNKVVIGPYAHLRPASIIGDEARIGNYVEVKKTFIGEGSKVGHLTYLGDATLGKKVNIGAGTITCNFDGKKKNPTTIEDGVFIGSNNSLVAPVTIGQNAYTAAGSTITQDVPARSLGIARSRQTNIAGWVEQKEKNKKENKDKNKKNKKN